MGSNRNMTNDQPTWTPGQPVSATKLNRMADGIRDAIGGMDGAPRRKQRMTPWELFDCEPSRATTIRVHGGISMRFVHGVLYTTNLTVESGSGDDPNNYKEVTVSASGYIVATLAGTALVPTGLNASYSATAPTAADETVIALAYVTVAGGSITDVRQIHTGIWFHFWQAPDGVSAEYNAANLLQLHGFATATNVMTLLPTSDLFAFKSYTDGDVQYANADNIVETACANGADITGSTGTPPAHTHTWDSLTDTDGNPAAAANVGKVGVVTNTGGSTYALQLVDGSDSTKELRIPCSDGTTLSCYAYHGRLVAARP